MTNDLFTGRTKPYAARGIHRIPCARCKAPSNQQWQACANGGRYVGICDDCDIELNEMVLKFMRLPNRGRLMSRYKKKMRSL
jgi:hypothetical protein